MAERRPGESEPAIRQFEARWEASHPDAAEWAVMLADQERTIAALLDAEQQRIRDAAPADDPDVLELLARMDRDCPPKVVGLGLGQATADLGVRGALLLADIHDLGQTGPRVEIEPDAEAYLLCVRYAEIRTAGSHRWLRRWGPSRRATTRWHALRALSWWRHWREQIREMDLGSGFTTEQDAAAIAALVAARAPVIEAGAQPGFDATPVT